MKLGFIKDDPAVPHQTCDWGSAQLFHQKFALKSSTPSTMNYPKRYEKALVEALRLHNKQKHSGPPSADDIYKLLDLNKQKRIRKQQIQTFLLRQKSAPDVVPSSQNSSTSEDNDSDSKRKYKKKNQSVSSSPEGKETEKRSARAIKPKRVFDPSDYSQVKKPDKYAKDPLCKLCGKGFKAETPEEPRPKKVSCSWCKKRRAHRACLSEDSLPWRCNDCRICSICDGDMPANSPMISCRICKDLVHHHCGNINDAGIDWTCPQCRPAKEEEVEPPKPKIKCVRRNSTVKKVAKNGSSLNHQDDEIPDCSRWTPQQVYSYLITYVPSDDAKAFLDQEIDGRSLKLMQRADVLGNFNLKLGPALKVYAQVKRLQDRSNEITLCWPE